MRTLFSRRWIGIHLGVWFAVAGCVALCWWQISRASEGNARSLGYAFEWPTFAIIILVMWVKAMRDELRGTPVVGTVADAEAPDHLADLDLPPRSWPTREEIVAADEAEDPELAAYNRRLAALHERDVRGR